MNRRFASPHFRPYRAMLYASLGSAALAFILHGLHIHGLAIQMRSMSLD